MSDKIQHQSDDDIMPKIYTPFDLGQIDGFRRATALFRNFAEPLHTTVQEIEHIIGILGGVLSRTSRKKELVIKDEDDNVITNEFISDIALKLGALLNRADKQNKELVHRLRLDGDYYDLATIHEYRDALIDITKGADTTGARVRNLFDQHQYLKPTYDLAAEMNKRQPRGHNEHTVNIAEMVHARLLRSPRLPVKSAVALVKNDLGSGYSFDTIEKNYYRVYPPEKRRK